MKTKSILIRLSKEEYDAINKTYKIELINGDLISRSEFIRKIIKLYIEKDNVKIN